MAATAKPFTWDPSQGPVVEASPQHRLVVEAGPGTGKTAVACGRVAHLINQGVEPANILLFSFTRTAVAELRDRICQLAGSEERARAVRITTLDSNAWQLRYGFGDEDVKKLFGSYERNIEEATQMLRSGHPDLLEFLGRIEHLIVDEAQDLIGSRAVLVGEIIRRLPAASGVTVYADPAQAIYGFTSEYGGRASGSGDVSLLTLLGSKSAQPFQTVSLKKIHRTKSKGLLRVFTEVRDVVLQPGAGGEERLRRVGEKIQELADGPAKGVQDFEPGELPNLVLYRRRFDVLMGSSFLSSAGVQHRLRMSGLPVAVHPWVGLLMGDFLQPVLDKAEFGRRWAKLAGRLGGDSIGEAQAWAMLARHAGDRAGRVDRMRLRRILARSRPPAEFCAADCGIGGPILGTIHASKGREADNVALMLPRHENLADSDLDEESRVLFVGATRAKSKLLVGSGYHQPFCSQVNGRVYRLVTWKQQPKAQVEFGREFDFDAPSVFANVTKPAQAVKAQEALASLVGRLVALKGEADPGDDFRYWLHVKDGSDGLGRIGAFNSFVNRDLFKIAEDLASRLRRSLRPPARLPYLYSIGLRTVVLPEDDPDVSRIPAPYSASGVFLAPVVSGFPTIFFANWRR